MKLVLSLKTLLLPEGQWKEFLSAKKPQTAARYERERARVMDSLRAGESFGLFKGMQGAQGKYKQKRLSANVVAVSTKVKGLTGAAKLLSSVKRNAERVAPKERHFHSFSAKVDVNGFKYYIRTPMYTTKVKAYKSFERRLMDLFRSYPSLNQLKVISIKYYQIPEGYAYQKK